MAGERAEVAVVAHADVVGVLVVAAWLHWCGAATPGDPTVTSNTIDGGLPAPVCAGCRFEVPLHKAAIGEVTVLYARESAGVSRDDTSRGFRGPETGVVGPAEVDESERDLR